LHGHGVNYGPRAAWAPPRCAIDNTLAGALRSREDGAVELRHLRYFVAVVEKEGLRRAACELHLTPSALSRALDQLEAQLGVELLQRSAYGVELTPAGRDLLGHARSILAHADQAAAAMREHAQRPPRLRVGAVHGVLAASELTLPILRAFRDAHSSLNLETTTLSWGDQVGPLIDDQVDVALVRGPIDHPEVELIPLAHEPRVLLVGTNSDLAGESALNVQDVLAEPTVQLAAPDAWARFWQLDDLRRTPHGNPDLPPARSVRQMQQMVATGRAVISTSGAVGRMAPTRANTLRDPARRGALDHLCSPPPPRPPRQRRGVLQHAGHTAHTLIGLVPGGTTA
jgi:DNA-binding transcriptional LysR family regulator